MDNFENIMTKPSPEDFTSLILAAGKGTRMKSDLPKVLHELLKKPMLWYLLNTFATTGFKRNLVVTGHGHDLLEKKFPDHLNDFIFQSRQLGTGHALQEAWPAVKKTGSRWLVVAGGDTPLVSANNLEQLIACAGATDADMGLLSLNLEDPSGYGRVARDKSGRVRAVIEARDYNPEEHGLFSGEVNSGIYFFRVSSLSRIIFDLDANNAQKEFYITQLVSLAYERNMNVQAVSAGDCPELLGINTPAELLAQEEYLRANLVDRLISHGVIIRCRDQVRIGPEAVIDPGADITGPCEIYGASFVAGGTRINSHCYIDDSIIRDSEIFSFSHIQGSDIYEGTTVGPFARLRPGTLMKKGSKAGNFVEVKNSSIGEYSKVNHLSYIGDTLMDREVNIGAGTITCNYDGRSKNRTIIEKQVFIGSNSSLVAPVTIGEGSMVGAGSTITSDVPGESLGIARSRQKNLKGKNPLKKNKNITKD